MMKTKQEFLIVTNDNDSSLEGEYKEEKNIKRKKERKGTKKETSSSESD